MRSITLNYALVRAGHARVRPGITTIYASEGVRVTLPHYIRKLQADAEADRARQAVKVELNREAEATAARDRMVPLDVRLGHLLATIPASVQHDGLSLPTLRTMLRGRRGGGCQSGELGAALRRLGWSRKRGWRGGEKGGFSALWFPPGA